MTNDSAERGRTRSGRRPWLRRVTAVAVITVGAGLLPSWLPHAAAQEGSGESRLRPSKTTQPAGTTNTNDAESNSVEPVGEATTFDILVTSFDAVDEVRRHSSDGQETGQLDTTDGLLGSANAITTGPDGFIYVAGSANRVLRFNPESDSFIDVAVRADSGIENPRGLAFRANGNLLVSSAGTNQVVEFNAETGEQIAVAAETALDNPGGIAVADDGLLWVASQNNDAVVAFDEDGSIHRAVRTEAGSGPRDVAINEGGRLFVAHYLAGRIGTITIPAGEAGRQAATAVSEEFTSDTEQPAAVSVGPDGALWVADYWTNEVQRFDLDTKQRLEPAATAQDDEAFGPTDLAFVAIDATHLENLDVEALTDGLATKRRGFEINQGQFDDSIDAALNLGGRPITLVDSALLIDSPGPDRGNVASLGLVGANPNVRPEPIAGSQLGRPVNYFIEDTAIVGAQQHDQIIYRDLLPGVDMRYTAESTGLTYDILLDAGVDPSTVQLQSGGTADATVDGRGRLVLRQPIGPKLRFSPPVTYQLDGDDRIDVESSYRVASDGTIGFTLADIDATLPLVIDPTLDLSTLIGGTGADYLIDVALDASGNIVVVGHTDSTNYPTTAGAYDTTFAADADVVVNKLDPTGSTLLWSTYLGGNGEDFAREVAVASTGDVVLVGDTASGGYPTTVGAYDTSGAALADSFVTRLSSDGSTMLASTFISGDGVDEAESLAIDEAGNVVVLGTTDSANFPSTAGVFQPNDSSGTDLFVTKLPADLSTLTWSTFLAGNGAETAGMLDLDASDNVWVVTGTDSTDMPTSTEAFGTTANGAGDYWVGALSADGSTLKYGTYLGGTGDESGPSSIHVVDETEIHVATTGAPGYPTTAGAYAETTTVSDTAYVVLDSTATGAAQLTYGSFLGGTDGGRAHDITVDDDGRAYIVGDAAAAGLATAGAPDTGQAGVWDGILAVMDPTTATMEFFTYIGGNGDGDLATGVTLNASNEPIVVGFAQSTDFTTTTGAYQTTMSGANDGFVQRYSAISPPVAASIAVVNSTGDGPDVNIGDDICGTGGTNADGDPECTLRAAIQEANSSPTPNDIFFDIPTTDSGYDPAGWWQIDLATDLPDATATVNIDATTQPSYAGDPIVGLTRGTAYGSVEILTLDTAATDSTVTGLAFAGSTFGLRIFSDRTVVTNNWFGILPDGTAASIQHPLVVYGDDVTVGQPGQGNIITNFHSRGITIYGPRAVVQGNVIGEDTLGTPPSQSAEAGIRVWSQDALIGGTNSGEGNRIAQLSIGTPAVEVGSPFSGATVLGNTINSVGLAVDLNIDGATANDVGDADTGANGLLNYPVPTVTAFATVNSTTYDVDLDVALDAPAGDYRVELYVNDGPGEAGRGEGQELVHAFTVTHVGGGTQTFATSYRGPWSPFLGATATEDNGDGTYGSTSEFSAVAGAADLTFTVNSTGDTADAGGDLACDTGGTNANGDPECTLRAAIEQANRTSNGTIEFDVPTSDPGYVAGQGWTIDVPSRFEELANPMTIDGSSQPSWTGDPVIGLAGTSATDSGLNIQRTGSVINGLSITGFSSRQIWADAGVTITGNWLGYRLDGTADPNYNAVYIQIPGGPVVVGGPGANDGNYITATSIGISFYYADGAFFQGNVVGVGPDGTPTPIPRGVRSNQSSGVLFGGTGPGEANVVANTTTYGFGVIGNNDDATAILGNTTYDNVIDIDINADGVTTNDVGDLDVGVNALLNYPVITSAVSAAGTTTVDYTLDVPAGNYRVETFVDLATGQTLAGSQTITHTGAGSEMFQVTFPDVVAGAFRATATEDLGGSTYGSTSELSAPYAICQDPDGDGLCSDNEVVFGDTDGDGTDNYLDDDDDGDGILTAAENADPNADGDPRDAFDVDRDGQPDWLDAPTRNTSGLARAAQKISDLSGGLTAALANNDNFGSGATAIGDLDGDGITDLAVGAPSTSRTATYDGAVYILLTNADGTVKAEQELSGATVSGLSLNTRDYFGQDVALVGDLDGDGKPELAIGAEGAAAVWILSLNPDGTAAANPTVINGHTDLPNPPTTMETFGYSVGALGDLNGDGINDLLVGDERADEGGWDHGAAHVIFLNSDGSVADNQVISDVAGGLTHTFVYDEEFGSSITSLGDVDGDGVTDIAVGAVRHGPGPDISQQGGVHILFLNTDGTVKAERLITNGSSGFGSPLNDNAWFGTDVAGVGDLDGDGTPDLLVGAPGQLVDGSETGVAYLLNLNPDGTANATSALDASSPAFAGLLDEYGEFGGSTAGLGDLDGNGTIDLLVGAPYNDDGGTARGAVYIVDLIPYITVNDTGDWSDISPGDGVCETGVTRVSDGLPVCTLRAAIEEANGVGSAYIEFDLITDDTGHTAGVWTINPATALPYATARVTIDATTQPGWAGDPLIAIDGAGFATTTDGLTLAGDYSTVTGLSVINWTGDGLSSSRSGLSLTSNWLGIAPDGAIAPNLSTDISLWGGAGIDNVVGGADPADGNLFAAAGADDGLFLHTTNVLVATNTFGLSADGVTSTSPPANAIRINGASTGVTIDANTFANTAGAAVDAAQGGTATLTNNTFGTALDDSPASVGLALATTGAGSVLFGGTSGEGNTVANTTGVAVLPNGTGVVSILGNSISSSGALGIDLANDGITFNDPGDSDIGSNGLLNYPVITSAVDNGGLVTLQFDLDVPAGTYRVELFANPSGANATGYGEGETLAYATTVTHAGAGAQAYSVSISGSAGDIVTATATEDLGAGTFGATSEFSAAAAVANPPDPILDHSVRRSDVQPAGGLDAVAAASTGITGSALALDGTTTRLTGPPLNVNASALSFGARFRPSSMSGTDYLLSKQSAGGTAIYELAIDGATSEAVATLNVGGSTVTVRGGAVSAATWHNAVATWDSSTLILYLDGVEVDRTAASGSLAADVTTSVVLGNRSSGTSGFDGLIDHVDIDHQAIAAEEVAARHANTIAGTLSVIVGQQQTGAPGDWTVSATQTRSGGFALSAPSTSVGSAAWAVATSIDEPGVVFDSWWWVDSAVGLDLAAGTRSGLTPTEQYDGAFVSADSWLLRRRYADETSVGAMATQPLITGSWVNVEQWTDQNGNSRLLVDGVEVAPWTGQSSPPSSGSVGLRAGALPGGQSWFIDDPRARKLVMPEPVATLSSLDQN